MASPRRGRPHQEPPTVRDRIHSRTTTVRSTDSRRERARPSPEERGPRRSARCGRRPIRRDALLRKRAPSARRARRGRRGPMRSSRRLHRPPSEPGRRAADRPRCHRSSAAETSGTNRPPESLGRSRRAGGVASHIRRRAWRSPASDRALFPKALQPSWSPPCVSITHECALLTKLDVQTFFRSAPVTAVPTASRCSRIAVSASIARPSRIASRTEPCARRTRREK